MANALGNNGGRFYSFGSQPVLIDCNFIVDSTNGNGLGIRSLKGQGVKNVYMHTTAAFTGTIANNSPTVTGIASGTATLQVGMPVQGTNIPSGTKILSILSSSSIALTANATGSATESITYQGVGKGGSVNVNPNPASGYAWIQLTSNYNRYLGGFSGFASQTSGSTIQINSGTAGLTVGKAYIVASVGAGPSGVATIAPVADVSGSLASRYFTLYDSYGNTFVLYFIVNGVGGPPNLGPAAATGPGLQYVPIVIATNASAATIGAALVTAINALPSGIVGTYSFTATGTTTVTVTSTAPAPLAGVPQDGSSVIPAQGPAIPITFTLSSAGSASANSVWTDGLGHLYTVTTNLSSGTTLQTSGIGNPNNGSAGTLTFVSGSGSTAALSFSSAAANYATGFTFALTTSDTNLADWQGVGLPKGLNPTVGQSFIATATGAGSSTGTAIAVGVSGITSVEVIGDPNQSFAPQPQGAANAQAGNKSSYEGGWILVQFLGPTSSSSTVPIPTAPANNSTVGMCFYVDNKFSPSNINL